MRSNLKAAVAALGMGAALLSGAASAITLAGSQVSYTFDETLLGKFGSASLVGDELVFTPVAGGFLAAGGGATQLVTVTVSANAGYLLSAFNLNESGGYTMPSAAEQVYVKGTFSALDIEGTTSNSVVSNILATAPLSATGSATGSWSAQSAITLPAAGWGGEDGLVQSVDLTISNQLFAKIGGEIWKDSVMLTAVTTPVPEAETYALMLAGLGLVGLMARRRAAAQVG